MELGVPPRVSEVVYDRKGSAASLMKTDEVDWSLLDAAKHLHVTGITAAISQSSAACVEKSIEDTRRRGKTVSFDVNYRKKLWTEEEAARILSPMMQNLDVLFLTREDAAQIFEIEGEPEEAARKIQKKFGSEWTVLTLGADGALILEGETIHRKESFPVQTIDRIGAGDAFVAGCLFGFLRDDLEIALNYGLAMAALKMATPGDLSFATVPQIEELIQGAGRSVRR
jgi:2-dehydro-3-deoxygluconokinase